jgi:hypothetical protein
MTAVLAYGRAARAPALEHDPEKWEPVSRPREAPGTTPRVDRRSGGRRQVGTRSCSKKRLAKELIVLCLWAAAGLALTAAAFAAGFGAELTQALGVAG